MIFIILGFSDFFGWNLNLVVYYEVLPKSFGNLAVKMKSLEETPSFHGFFRSSLLPAFAHRLKKSSIFN